MTDQSNKRYRGKWKLHAGRIWLRYRFVRFLLVGGINTAFSLLGFATATVYYERTERFAGESKYPWRRMLALALDGVTSFSGRALALYYCSRLADMPAEHPDDDHHLTDVTAQ